MQEKIKYFVIILAFVGKVSAQVPCNEPSVKENNQNILRNLDKTQIPNQTLYDAVYPFADLEGYTGSTTTDTSNGFHFLQAYSEIYNSRVTTNGYTHPSDYFKKITNSTLDQNFYHLVGLIDYQFATIKQDAISLNLLTVNNGLLYDVPNRTSSPYETKQTQIGAVLNSISERCFRAGTHYFHFDAELVLENTGFNLNDVTYIQIFFGNIPVYQGSVSGLDGQDIPFPVTNVDAQTVVRMVLTTATTSKTYRFSICSEERENITSCSGEDVFNVTGPSYSGGYKEGAYSALGRGTIYYATANCALKRITKPIIFVDGFDPFNTNDGNFIYDKYLNGKFNENGIDKRLGAELRDAGYDLIIYDEIPDPNKDYNTGGGGYIEHNGMALATFLNQFYNAHAGTIVDDFVVVGASMGGLISRYALTYAEHENIPHHTRLFVAFDSPQNGAQIPIGVQTGLDKFFKDGILSGKDKISNALHQSNAAKQLLLHHADADSETPVSHPYRASFYQHLEAMGNWPTQCRMVSIACGNGKGRSKSIVPNPNPDNVPPLLSCAKNLDIGIKSRLPILLPCYLDYCYKMRLETYLSTSNTRCLALDYSLNNTRLLNLVGPYYPLLSKKTYTQSGTGGNLDTAPGARFGNNPLSALTTAYKIISYIVTGPFVEHKNDLFFGNFIPTTSAAAYTFPNGEALNYHKDFTGVNLSRCAGTTPFDTVYLQNNDLAHVEIDVSIANSFRSEIYLPKAKSVCAGPCVDFVTLNSSNSPSASQTVRAAKAIILEPNHIIPTGTVFKTEIGCLNTSLITEAKTKNILSSANFTLNNCPFEFINAQNQTICENSFFSKFRVYTRNFDLSPYVEFSTNNGLSWNRANIGDNGCEYTINSNSSSQNFKARPKNDPTNIIALNLSHCN